MAFEQKGNETDEMIVCGKNAVAELLKSRLPVDTLFLSQAMPEKEQNYYVSLAREKGAVVKRIHPVKLEKMCGNARHQGIAALQTIANYCELEDLLELAAERGEPPFLVLLDGITDPHNLGAIIRTAECAGLHGVVVPKRGGAAVNTTVSRASAGAAAHLPIARVANLASAVRSLKQAGVFCYCADMGAPLAYDTDLTGALAIVVGAEGAGVSQLVRELCDGAVSLPILGKVESLNASVAAGAVIYEAVRQRLARA